MTTRSDREDASGWAPLGLDDQGNSLGFTRTTGTAPAGLPLHESADRDADNAPSDRVRATYATGHGFTPRSTPFGGGDRCTVMLARYPCPYSREQHDPAKPPEDVDCFGYRRPTPTEDGA